ncbi:MAG TPA: carboxypeptidase-like regulatory domain-containing protein, partial [Prolixibacteraceae bacterium]
MPFASVSLVSENTTSQTGTVSKGDGSFEIDNVSFGKYRLIVYFMGYKTDTISKLEISKQTSRLNLGTIRLKPISISVQEVQIQANAKTNLNKIDRQTYRAVDFATAKGGTATDLLSKLPSVSVDPDGSVSVRGTTDFVVYLNGKPTQMDPSALLGQISGAQIENVEIISIPTAKYDSQGKGGIININTKKTGAEGLSASVNGLLGGAPWSNVTDRYDGFKLNDDRYGGG